MKITKHGKTTEKEKTESFKCEKCGCEDCPNASKIKDGTITLFVLKCNCGRPIRAGQTYCKCGMKFKYS